jgi:hypothetical protein
MSSGSISIVVKLVVLHHVATTGVIRELEGRGTPWISADEDDES